MPEFDPLSLPEPIREPEGPRWIPWTPPPLSEWFYTGGVSGPPSWTLHCPPIFEVRIRAEGEQKGARLHCELNCRHLGHFYKLDAAKQRAEREIVSLFRATIPHYAVIRRHLRNMPMIADAAPPAQKRRIAQSYKPPPDPAEQCKCQCGFTYRDRQVMQVSLTYGRVAFYCNDCLPTELKKELTDLAPKPPAPVKAEARCACGELATYVRDGRAFCDKCYDPRGSNSGQL